MSKCLTLSIDAMGGDNSPQMVVEGIDLALNELADVRFLLFGDEGQLAPLLGRFPRVAATSEIRHTPDVVTNEEKPGNALRTGRQSSMRLAINVVGDGEAAGVVSAGNTGALMAMAKFVLKTLPGIDRPAIASSMPTMKGGQVVVLDLGANVECDADNLVQFAVMGEVFARNLLGLKQPSIGILNIGAEVLKGNEAVKAAAAVLQVTDLPIKFYGFIEGDDIARGTVDVVVTDGFTGNVVLKTLEGASALFRHFLKEALTSTLLARIGALFAMPALNAHRMRVDPRRYNGALFLGLNGVCVKSHGGTDALGFANAVKVAVEMIQDDLVEAIKVDFGRLNADRQVDRMAAASL